MFDLWLGREGEALHLDGVSLQPPLKGCLYLPGVGNGDITKDQLTLQLESVAPMDFAVLIAAIEQKLSAAQLFTDRGLGQPVWLGVQLFSSDEIWRSQVICGRLETAGNGLSDSVRGRRKLRLEITRRDHFEGNEVELPLTNRNGSRVKGGLVVSNHSDVGHDNFVLIDGGDVISDLPSRLRLAVINTNPTAIRNLFVDLNAHSNPVGFGLCLEAESGSGGVTLSSMNCSGSNYQLLDWSGPDEVELITWLLSAGLVADACGNAFRYLFRLAQVVAAEELWLRLRVRGGAESVILGETDWALIKAGESLQELGPLPLPPGLLPPGTSGMPLELTLVARQSGEGEHTLALDYLGILALDGFRRYESLAGLPENGQLIDDPVGGVASFQPGTGWLATHQAIGAPLELLPGKTQRLSFFQDDVTGLAPIERGLNVRAWCRPRRRVL